MSVKSGTEARPCTKMQARDGLEMPRCRRAASGKAPSDQREVDETVPGVE